MDLEAELDRIYSLPLAEFVAARNALAKELRASGDREGANEVKTLAKPNVPAWAVNRLWHDERKAFARLLEAGSEVKASLGSGGAGREAADQRAKAARALLTRAKKLLAEAGHPTSPALLQKISHTLDAVVALGVERLDPPPGRLSRDLEPPGFDFLAGLTLPPAPRLKPRVREKSTRKKRSKPAPDSGSRRTAREAAREAKQAERIEAARAALGEKRAALAAAEKEAERSDRALADARETVSENTAKERKAELAAKRAADRTAAAKDNEKEAAKALRAARAKVRRAAGKVETAKGRLDKLAG